MRTKLRLFVGDDEQSEPEQERSQATIELGELARVLSDATYWDRTWLTDFADERVTVSTDLYELLQVYSAMRPSA